MFFQLLMKPSRQKNYRKKTNIGASAWPAKCTDFVKEAWAGKRKKHKKPSLQRKSLAKDEKSGSETEGNFVLIPAPRRPNVQTTSLEPGQGT